MSARVSRASARDGQRQPDRRAGHRNHVPPKLSLTGLGDDQYASASMYSQCGGEPHQANASTVSCRNRWLDDRLARQHLEAVVALGALADGAWRPWKSTSSADHHLDSDARVHPWAQLERTPSGDRHQLGAAIEAALQSWNGGQSQSLFPSPCRPAARLDAESRTVAPSRGSTPQGMRFTTKCTPPALQRR